MTGRDTWRMVWATDGVAEDLDRLPQNLIAASLAMRAKAAVVGLTVGRWDKDLAGHTPQRHPRRCTTTDHHQHRKGSS